MRLARSKANIIILCISAVLLYLVYRYGQYGTEPVPLINEICTVNFSVAADRGGNYLDYLELYNPYDEDYVMDGLWLSDDKDEAQQFDMTGIVVPAHGYSVIWMMDEEDLPEVTEDLEEAMSTDVVDIFETPTTLDCQQYYCTFDVSRKGGYLYISNSDSKILESVTVPALTYNVAYGRTTDGGSTLSGMEPTLGASNDGAAAIVLDKAEDPVLSAESGFYDDAFELSISHALGTQVYYTLDGSTPTTSSMQYEESILIDDASDNPNVYSARDDIYPDVYVPEETVDKAVVVRAIAVDESSGAMSDVVSGTYFVGFEDKDAYEDIAVVSLITDPDNLYDYDTGIYVRGAAYDLFKEMGGYEDLGESEMPSYVVESDGNQIWEYKFTNSQYHGREWEREVTVEYYGTDHSLQLSQDAGMRIAGLSSRFHGQKSLNLYARKVYGEDIWQYPFWGYEGTSKIRLRSSDDEAVNWKETFVHSLAEGRSCGVQRSIPVAVFMDGEYWGMYQLTEQYDTAYFENHYDVDPDDLVVMKNSEITEGDAEAKESWDFLEDLMKEYDPAYDYYYTVMSERADMDSLLDFYATTIYLNNQDIGPRHNRTQWFNSAEGADNRWELLIFDMDATLGDPEDNTLAFYSEDERFYWPMFLCNNEEFKERYVTTIMDLANVEYSYNRVHGRLVAKAGYLEQQSIENKHRNWDADYDEADYAADVGDIDTFFRLRRSYMEQYLKEDQGLSDIATVTITNSNYNAGAVKVNTSVLTEEDYAHADGETVGTWTGEYFTDYNVTLTAVPLDGYVFTGWSGDVESVEATITVPLTGDGVQVCANFAAAD